MAMTADLHKVLGGKKIFLNLSSISVLLVIFMAVLVSGAVEDGGSSSSKIQPKKGIVLKVPGTMATSMSSLKPKIQKIGRPRQFWSDQLQIESSQHQKQQASRNYAMMYQQQQQQTSGGGHAKGGVPTSFGITTLVAVSLVSAFLGAMTYSAFDGRGQNGGTGRSVSEGVYSLLNLIDPDAIIRMMTSTDWEDDASGSASTGFGNNSTLPITRRGRIIREQKQEQLSPRGPLMKWYQAYRKDPVEMRCVHKLICENLATTSCAAKTINPEFDGTVLNFLKFFMGSMGVSELITETVGNPRLCKEIFIPYDLCTTTDEGEKGTVVLPEKPTTSTLPPFNLTSIVPRVKYAPL